MTGAGQGEEFTESTHIMEEQLPAAGHTGGEEVTRHTPALK